MSSQFGRQVGELGSNKPRQVIRSAKNPIDKSTIISIFDREINEVKHTIEPGRFRIAAGSPERPATLVVGSSSWWSDRDAEQPMLEIPVSSVQVANAIIRDYCVGILACDMEGSMPGLFFVLGEVNSLEVKTKYKDKLAEAKAKQDNWFRSLVTMADSLWARANGNPLVISNEMRLAARSLNLNDKPWLKDFQATAMMKCMGCGNLRNPEYPICPSCKLIDQSHPHAKELKFAQ